MSISWSQKVAANKCLRNWELGYVERLERIPGVSHLNRIRGSAFHAAVEAAFRNPSAPVVAALVSANKYLDDNTMQDKLVWDYEFGEYRPDNAYYEMMEALKLEMPGLLQYHIPLIGINTKYRVATFGELFGGSSGNLLLEYHIEGHVSDMYVHGYIDAILVDLETGERVVTDWKLRQAFERDEVVQVDGQLMFYAALLRRRGASISKSMQWQFRKKTPSPASISKKTKKPNTGAKTYDTTWEHWVETLPAGIDPAKYEEVIKPKLKDDSHYQKIVETVITDASCNLSLDDMAASIEIMEYAKARELFPATQSSMACQYCDFLMLCATPLKHGGDATELIASEYRSKDDIAESK
ncbi:hypothetical protein LCGC14_0702690 [marine sediment metagenome]|uniref:PD-(D/E)XK endonuclease-like domain-containing protein n=1 Tax=marine sediment metagenome TaxID=412755 RepID=A0A0F9TQ20_9ZZZZ